MTQPTPQDKAKELVERFKPHTRTFSETRGWEDNLHDASQCALICCEEIKKAFDIGLDVERKYWQSVKTEIEKL